MATILNKIIKHDLCLSYALLKTEYTYFFITEVNLITICLNNNYEYYIIVLSKLCLLNVLIQIIILIKRPVKYLGVRFH